MATALLGNFEVSSSHQGHAGGDDDVAGVGGERAAAVALIIVTPRVTQLIYGFVAGTSRPSGMKMIGSVMALAGIEALPEDRQHHPGAQASMMLTRI